MLHDVFDLMNYISEGSNLRKMEMHEGSCEQTHNISERQWYGCVYSLRMKDAIYRCIDCDNTLSARRPEDPGVSFD